MSAEGEVRTGNMVRFTVEYPNNVYLTMRSRDTDQTEFKPFTISYGRVPGLPFASVWKDSLPIAGASRADADPKGVTTTPASDEGGLPAFVVILLVLIGLLLAAAGGVFLARLLKNRLKSKQQSSTKKRSSTSDSTRHAANTGSTEGTNDRKQPKDKGA